MRNPLEIELQAVSDGSANVDLISPLQPEGALIVLQRVAVTNETNNASTATIGLMLGSSIKWLETLTITSLGLYYALTEPIYTTAQRRLVVRFKSTSDGDVLRVYAYGYYRK